MGAFSAYTSKKLLDWTLGGAPAPQPTARWLGLVDISGTEIAASGYARASAVFGAASSPQGTASMVGGKTFGPMTLTAVLTVGGCAVYDSNSSGNVLASTMYATPLSAANNGGVIVRSLDVSLS